MKMPNGTISATNISWGLVLNSQSKYRTFFMKKGNLALKEPKTVADINAAGKGDAAKLPKDTFNKLVKLGNVVWRSGKFRRFGINVEQKARMGVGTDARDMFNSLKERLISHQRLKQQEEHSSNIERASFASINS